MATVTSSTVRLPIGNEAVGQRLEAQWITGVVPHAQLFAGPEGVGKRLWAQTLAQQLFRRAGTAAAGDLIELAPEGKMDLYPLPTLQELRTQAFLTSLNGSWKIYILEAVERMSLAAANSLLKVLEEPPSNTLFLLISAHPGQLLPTLLSRCHVLSFHALSMEQVAMILVQKGLASSTEASRIAKRSLGSMARARQLLANLADPHAQQLLNLLSRLHLLTAPQILQGCSLLDLDRQSPEGSSMAHEQRELLERYLQVIADWCRDLYLLTYGLEEELLFSSSRLALEEQLQLGMPSPQDLEPFFAQARIAGERSVKFSVILSGLLLQLRKKMNS